MLDPANGTMVLSLDALEDGEVIAGQRIAGLAWPIPALNHEPTCADETGMGRLVF